MFDDIQPPKKARPQPRRVSPEVKGPAASAPQPSHSRPIPTTYDPGRGEPGVEPLMPELESINETFGGMPIQKPYGGGNLINDSATSEETLPPDPETDKPQTVPLESSKKSPKLLKGPSKNPWHRFQAWWTKLRKKQKIIFIVILVAVLAALGGGAYAWYKHNQPAAKQAAVAKKTAAKKKIAPKPTTVASRLTGMQIAPELNNRPVTGIMIENSTESRPQSGLKDAGVIYEAIAEGGITRFATVFLESQPDYIGPVRSVRPYYLDFLAPYDASIAHVGGSGEALAQLKSQGLRDIDQFSNSAYYHRIPERAAPHNVYTSIAKLNELEQAKGYSTSTFTGFARKAKEGPLTTPTAKVIDLNISGFLYNVHYDYDATTNSYKRSVGGKPHTDERSGQQLAPKVVVALALNRGIAADGSHTQYTTTGSGSMFVFQDGIVTQGTWQKTDRKSQFVFTDPTGKPLKLNPGQTWVTIVDAAGKVTYTP